MMCCVVSGLPAVRSWTSCHTSHLVPLWSLPHHRQIFCSSKTFLQLPNHSKFIETYNHQWKRIGCGIKYDVTLKINTSTKRCCLVITGERYGGVWQDLICEGTAYLDTCSKSQTSPAICIGYDKNLDILYCTCSKKIIKL